jgi:hypothetical protein
MEEGGGTTHLLSALPLALHECWINKSTQVEILHQKCVVVWDLYPGVNVGQLSLASLRSHSALPLPGRSHVTWRQIETPRPGRCHRDTFTYEFHSVCPCYRGKFIIHTSERWAEPWVCTYWLRITSKLLIFSKPQFSHL